MKLPNYFCVVLVFVLSSFSIAFGQETVPASNVTRPYMITYQPKATYTDQARDNNVAGGVRLKITLLASGQVGTVTLIKTKGWKKLQKYGLVQRAIDAAKKIEFTPKMVNGVSVSVVVTREYTFTIF